MSNHWYEVYAKDIDGHWEACPTQWERKQFSSFKKAKAYAKIIDVKTKIMHCLRVGRKIVRSVYK